MLLTCGGRTSQHCSPQRRARQYQALPPGRVLICPLAIRSDSKDTKATGLDTSLLGSVYRQLVRLLQMYLRSADHPDQSFLNSVLNIYLNLWHDHAGDHKAAVKAAN